MTLTEQNELDAIRARREYGIHRASDYNREHELTATGWTRLGEFAIIGFCIALTAAKFGFIVQAIGSLF